MGVGNGSTSAPKTTRWGRDFSHAPAVTFPILVSIKSIAWTCSKFKMNRKDFHSAKSRSMHTFAIESSWQLSNPLLHFYHLLMFAQVHGPSCSKYHSYPSSVLLRVCSKCPSNSCHTLGGITLYCDHGCNLSDNAVTWVQIRLLSAPGSETVCFGTWQ